MQYVVTKNFNCVPFSDLPDDVREKVREKLASWETKWDWWEIEYDCFADDMVERYGIEINTKKSYFSLYPTCASWTLKRITNWEKLLSALEIAEETECYYITDWNDSIEFRAYSGNHGGQYAELDYFTMNDDENDSCLMNEDQQEYFMQRVSRNWHDFCMDIAHEFGKRLEKEYEYRTSEDYLSEMADVNEMIFDIETGEIFHLSDIENS